VVGRIFYIFGGRIAGSKRSGELFALDTATMHWSKVRTGGSLPCGREFHTCTAFGGELFVYGGWDGVRWLSDCFAYNIERNEWRQLNPRISPPARSGHCAQVIADGSTGRYCVCVVGGGGGGHGTYLNDVWMLDPSYEWRRSLVSGSIMSRSGHSASVMCTVQSIALYTYVVARTTIAVIGGHGIESRLFGLRGREVYFNDVHLFDSQTQHWTTAQVSGATFTARAYHSCVSVDGVAIIFGGWNGNETFGDLMTLEPGKCFIGLAMIVTFCQ